MGSQCSCALSDDEVPQLNAVLVEATHRTREGPADHPRRPTRANPMLLPTAAPRPSTSGTSSPPTPPMAHQASDTVHQVLPMGRPLPLGVPILSVDDGPMLVSFRTHAFLLGSSDSSDPDNDLEEFRIAANSVSSSLVRSDGRGAERHTVAIVPLQSPKSGEYKEQIARRRRRHASYNRQN